MKPRFPIYVVSKSRADSRLTVKALLKMQLDFLVIIEKEQYEDYAAVIDPKHLLILDKTFQETYNTCDELGDVKSKGPGPARNFAWEHSIGNGFKWHWVMDDNIRCWCRMNKNLIVEDFSGNGFYAMEEFCLRYTNVVMGGPHYEMFILSRVKHKPFVPNRRVYSCNLIRNDLPFRWRGRYNEDTDLSLNILKMGLCTIQFNCFLQKKIATQRVKGGNTKDFYEREGTINKSKMLVKLHPNVAKLVMRWGRVHHYVDYAPFKSNQLIRDPSVKIPDGPCLFESQLGERV
jgi:hypothetical protein